jgi:hypothetical protein
MLYTEDIEAIATEGNRLQVTWHGGYLRIISVCFLSNISNPEE